MPRWEDKDVFHQSDVTICPMIMKTTTNTGKNQKQAEMGEESFEVV